MKFSEYARMIAEQMEAQVLMQHLAVLYLLEHPGFHRIDGEELERTESYVVQFEEDAHGCCVLASLQQPDVKTFGEAPLKLVKDDDE